MGNVETSAAFSQLLNKGDFPMKRVIRASENTHKAERMFSMGDFLFLLQQIKELQGLEVSLSKVLHEGTQLVVGDNVYPLKDIFPGRNLYE